MNTAVTQCPRCTGTEGAHFAFCFVARAWERFMGPGYPWAPTKAAEPAEYPLPPEPPDDGWDWDEPVEDLPPTPGVKPQRVYNTAGLAEAKLQHRQTQEDAAVQFVYDRIDTTPGGRVRLDAVHAKYVEWQQANDRPAMSKKFLRELLAELGLQTAPGRMPGDRTAGRPPLLVVGVTLRTDASSAGGHPAAKPKLPVVVVKLKQETHSLLAGKPGGELPKEWRELVEPLITKQGWAYESCNSNGRGKPRLVTPDGKTVTLPSTPHVSGRTLQNTRSFLKQNGAEL